MNILLVYPKYPDTFWSYRYALKFISRKASFPPLGLLTVASMLPVGWAKKLIDCNVEPLKEKELRWADAVFISGMSAQKESADEIIKQCKDLGKLIVAGGPLFTAHAQGYGEVDHLVLNEAEITLPEFLWDLENGTLKHSYTTDRWADIKSTPIPSWDLINMKHYGSMNIQYSRGCPYDCEFCDITVLYGRVPRTKTKEQVSAELDALYNRGWRGGVFFVDDNFIGNKEKLRKEILPSIVEWMKAHNHPFNLNTEASINLADDEELMRLMTRAGFDTVFVGIESPNEESLVECRKVPNNNRDLVGSVKKLQKFGLEVQGGFIVGFDQDPSTIFERLIQFIQETNIVTAMVGLLNAPPGTRLHKRLLGEGRILNAFSGNNTDFSMNFLPRMDLKSLMEGYQKVLNQIYSPKDYYKRVKGFLKDFKPIEGRPFRFQSHYLKALVKSVFILGIVGKERVYYWRLFFWSLFNRPRMFPLAITFAIYGFHFRRVFEQYMSRL
ncbi:DUF4070 domain-containing protein [bacterium]|nr:MAG: DUF4070 domain-containing protein [bacterium]